jgi:hypothetical protein
MTTVPLAGAKGRRSARIRLRFVSNEAYFYTLARSVFRQPKTFQVKVNGQETSVTATPLSGARAVHIQAGDVAGIISLGQDDPEPTTSAITFETMAILAILTIVVVGAGTMLGMVYVTVTSDEGSGEAETETEARIGDGEGEGDGEGSGDGEGGESGGGGQGE